MKIRIKGDSIRYRLTRTEVSNLANDGYVEEQTHFSNGVFIYRLETNSNTELEATLGNHSITLSVPVTFAKEWPFNEEVGLRSMMKVGSSNLILLLEKDFVCLDETTEDQSDNYANPNQVC